MRIVGVLVLGTLACSSASKDQVLPAREIVLQQEWFPNANYAGALMAQEHFAPKAGINLRIQPGSDNVDAVKLLIAGKVDFIDVGADRIAEAVAKGADLVVVGVVSPASPTVFLTRKGQNITSPAQFVGHRIGVLAGTNTELIYRLLKRNFRLDGRVTEVDAPFDLATFISGAYDVRPAFAYDEPVSLGLQHVDVDVVDPAKYDIKFVGTVYATRRDVARDTATVRRVVFALADGWRAAKRAPDEAIRLLKRLDPSVSEHRESLSLSQTLPYVFARGDNRLLLADPQDWRGMIANLRVLGLPVDTAVFRWVDTTFASRYNRVVAP